MVGKAHSGKEWLKFGWERDNVADDVFILASNKNLVLLSELLP